MHPTGPTAASMRMYIEGMDDVDASSVCRRIKKALVRSFGDMHELVLLGMPCDSELMADLGYVRDAFGRRSMLPSRRALLRQRVVNMLDRHYGDASVVGMVRDALRSLGHMRRT